MNEGSIHSSSRLTFVTPARPAGNVTITITSTSGSAQRAFTYVTPVARVQTGARRPAFSYSGQYVAFESRYALVPGDTNGVTDIYVRDRATGAVRRVSVASSGAQALGGESTRAAISATGRFVAFESRATNLVPGDTNGALDVFLHDRDVDADGVLDESGAIATIRVSVSSAGGSPTAPIPPAQGIGDSGDPAMTGDGRYVVFRSAAANLVAGDTNAHTDVLVHDRLRRVTSRVSLSSLRDQGDGDSRNPAMSLDGRYVVFESLATTLTSDGDGNNRFDVFLHDRDFDGDGIFDEQFSIDTMRISSNLCEANLTNHSVDPSITADGRYVVFSTVAGSAVVDGNGQPTIDTSQVSDIFLWDRAGAGCAD